MEAIQAMEGMLDRPADARGWRTAPGPEFEQHHRAQICSTVYDMLSAARSGMMIEYLGAIPITRLNAAQRAFREIGATGLATAVRTAQFGVTRAGAPLRLPQAVANLSAALASSTEDVDLLIANYWRVRITTDRVRD